MKITGVLIGALISFVVLFVTVAATFPTESAVSKMISLESPYVKDRSLILYRLEQIEKKLDKLIEMRPE